MELFTKPFGGFLLFVYSCFDRTVINGSLSGLSRPEQVVHFYHRILGVPKYHAEVRSGTRRLRTFRIILLKIVIIKNILRAEDIGFMKSSAIFLLVGMAILAAQNSRAGSAVAISPHNQMAASYGYPKEIAKQRALNIARTRYGANVRILTATDVTGYCAIAVAAKGKGSVVGVALGRPSAADAANRAIEQCLILGGTNPRIRWRFKG